MISFITGVVVGAGAVVAKDYLSGNADKANSQKNEVEQLYAENEKLRNRVRDSERKIEDLLADKELCLNKVCDCRCRRPGLLRYETIRM